MTAIMEPMDEQNPLGVVHMLRGKLKEAVQALTDEQQLEPEFKLRRRLEPTNTDYSLRTSFWRQYETAVKSGKNLITANMVFNGICSDSYFYQKFLLDRDRVAWLVRPMQTYMREVEAILVRSGERLWELVDMDVSAYDFKTGELLLDRFGRPQIDPKKGQLLLDVIKMTENRALGLAVARNETKTLHAHLTSPKRAAITGAETETLDARIQELEGRVNVVVSPRGEVVEAAFEDDDLAHILQQEPSK